ncbi:hypothetical protein ABIA33_000014 [Streptacidiphilus sp. MAP12-16]
MDVVDRQVGVERGGVGVDLVEAEASRDIAGFEGLQVAVVLALVADQRAVEKSVSALSQIASSTWSGVSSCGEWPVPVSSWNRAMGMAAA